MLRELRETFPPCIMLNGRLERPAGLWIQQKLSGLKCQREKKKKMEKKHFSHCQFKPRRAEPTDADRQRKKTKEREKGRRQSGNAVVNTVYCDD